MKELNKYIPLQEATKYCSYSQEYLSLRARQGKLKSIKIGRNWVTTKEWLEEYLWRVKEESKFISLQEATKYCSYSQDYLSLLARLEKLRSVKIGRNWVTTKVWLQEYLQKIEDYDNGGNTLRPIKTVPPPDNLPIIEESLYELSFPALDEKLPISKIKFAIAFSLVCLIFVVSGVVGTASLKSFCKDLNPYAQKISESFLQVSEITFEKIAKQKFIAGILSGTISTVKDFSKWLGRGIKFVFSGIADKFARAYKTISRLWKGPEKIAEEKPIPKPTKEGMIVVPSTDKDEEVKKKISESFSDETRVEIKDETSGIITPVFKDREGEKYLYLLVPIN